MSRPLPPGWERKIDPKSGRPVFVNHITKTTSWNEPSPVAPAAPVRSPYSAPVVASRAQPHPAQPVVQPRSQPYTAPSAAPSAGKGKGYRAPTAPTPYTRPQPTAAPTYPVRAAAPVPQPTTVVRPTYPVAQQPQPYTNNSVIAAVAAERLAMERERKRIEMERQALERDRQAVMAAAANIARQSSGMGAAKAKGKGKGAPATGKGGAAVRPTAVVTPNPAIVPARTSAYSAAGQTVTEGAAKTTPAQPTNPEDLKSTEPCELKAMPRLYHPESAAMRLQALTQLCKVIEAAGGTGVTTAHAVAPLKWKATYRNSLGIFNRFVAEHPDHVSSDIKSIKLQRCPTANEIFPKTPFSNPKLENQLREVLVKNDISSTDSLTDTVLDALLAVCPAAWQKLKGTRVPEALKTVNVKKEPEEVLKAAFEFCRRNEKTVPKPVQAWLLPKLAALLKAKSNKTNPCTHETINLVRRGLSLLAVVEAELCGMDPTLVPKYYTLLEPEVGSKRPREDDAADPPRAAKRERDIVFAEEKPAPVTTTTKKEEVAKVPTPKKESPIKPAAKKSPVAKPKRERDFEVE